MFHWLWITVWSVIILPLAAVLLSGRAPQWMRRQSTPGGLKVKGIAALVLYTGVLIPAIPSLAGMRSEDAEFLRMVLVPSAVFAGHGLILGATLCDRFNRSEATPATHSAWSGSEG
ncbi:hypothetical protein OHS70_21605 [Streptomyces sp. NBC_00390]|uniref:hypothetical protein n=1 Tax=Streptomyces sp. NBC_00390 TaxID=2975736 RepID=UPI002E23ACDA